MIFTVILKGCYLTTESTIPLQLWSKGLRCLLPVESTGCHLTCRGLVKSNRQKNAPQRPDIWTGEFGCALLFSIPPYRLSRWFIKIVQSSDLFFCVWIHVMFPWIVLINVGLILVPMMFFCYYFFVRIRKSCFCSTKLRINTQLFSAINLSVWVWNLKTNFCSIMPLW